MITAVKDNRCCETQQDDSYQKIERPIRPDLWLNEKPVHPEPDCVNKTCNKDSDARPARTAYKAPE
jgi:hypothetical protein